MGPSPAVAGGEAPVVLLAALTALRRHCLEDPLVAEGARRHREQPGDLTAAAGRIVGVKGDDGCGSRSS